VLWSAVQPVRGAAFNWDAPGTGGFPLRAQVRAVRDAGLEPVVTFYSTPPWAAQPKLGCEPPRMNVNARAPRADALPDYRALVGGFLAMARGEGVDVRYLSAWNEPNSALFLSPQRGNCRPGSPSIGYAPYAALVRELRAALDGAPGRHEVVLGEVSSPYAPRPLVSTATEFVERLPPDVMCAGRIWAQHQYAGDADGVAQVEPLLRRVGCAPREVWVTETGAGSRKPGAPRSYEPARLRAACRALDDLLRRWHRDPEVTAAFQYTLREDPGFPVGLAAAAGSPTYPTYELWKAWGARARPTDPPPPLPPSCR
jgi:hypothetical protein